MDDAIGHISFACVLVQVRLNKRSRFTKGLEALLDTIRGMFSLASKDGKYVIEQILSDHRLLFTILEEVPRNSS